MSTNCEHDNNNSINEFDSSSDIHELEGTFKGSECAQKISSESNLKVHLSLIHDISILSSNLQDVDKIVKSKVQPKIHDEKPDDLPKELNLKKLYTCKCCNQTFNSAKEQKIHTKKCKGNELFEKSKETLEIKEKSKVSEQFECTICDAVFTLKENLNKHIESFHDASKSKEPLKCKICYYIGTSIQEMKNHADLTHEGSTSLSIFLKLKCKAPASFTYI